MTDSFYKRFDISIGLEEARERFVNRVHNEVLESFLDSYFNVDQRHAIARMLATALGDRFHWQMPTQVPRNDFGRNLFVLETLHAHYSGSPYEPLFDKLLQSILDRCEVDLGVRWESGQFIRTGARALDEKLVDDVLHWLREQQYESILTAYKRGLGHLVAAEKEPSRASDVITDMYEALEGVAKRVTGRNADLSANAELFISKVKASDGYKRILKEYIAYANEGLRHAVSAGKPKPTVNAREAESFVYLTGVFIRLAIS